MKRCRLINLPYILTPRIFIGPNYEKHRFNNRNCFLSKIPSSLETPWPIISRSEISRETSFPKTFQPSRLSQSSHYSKEYSENNKKEEEDNKWIKKAVEDTDTALDSLGHKMAQVFNSAGEKLDEVLARSTEETLKEIGETEKSIYNMIKGLNVDESVSQCLSKYKADLEGVRTGFTAASKHCGETALQKLKNTRSSQETRVEEARAFNMSIKKMFEDCERDGKALRKCLWSERIKIQNRFTDSTELLNRVAKDAEQKATEVFEDARNCHLGARKKAVKDLREILTDSARCFSPKARRLENEICVEEAREQVKTTFNLLRQDLLSCTKYFLQISAPDQDTRKKQKLLEKSQEILVDLRNVSRGCFQAADLFSYANDEISNLQTKLELLQGEVNKTFSHVPHVMDKSYMFEECCSKAIENAIGKLRNVEKNFNQCSSLSESRK